jgi:hypothetical protein
MWVYRLRVGIMAIKAGMFPMPDSRHNSWGVLQNFVIITPFFLLMGVWKWGHSWGLEECHVTTFSFRDAPWNDNRHTM